MTKISRDLVWLYTWFQIITKGILALVVLPAYSLVVDSLIYMTGRTNISSGDFISFIFSFQGLWLLVFTLALLVIITAFDINSFIVASALIRENKMNFSIKSMLALSLRSARTFISIKGMALLAYVAVFLPLTGIGIGLSVTKNFKIPNFIASVIEENALYSAAYGVVILALVVVSIRYIFVFHYALIEGEPLGSALRKSARLLKGRWKRFVFDFFIRRALASIFLVVLIVVLAVLGIYGIFELGISVFAKRALSIFLLLTSVGAVGYIFFMMVPYVFTRLTDFFYIYSSEDGAVPVFRVYRDVEPGVNKARVSRFAKASMLVLLVGIILLNTVYSLFVASDFEVFFYTDSDIAIVAHRGGGDLSAENSLDGLIKAAEYGAAYSEIDIQRTADGHYIINHDKTFKRLAGVDRASSEMTLDEIKQLRIKNLFDVSQPDQEVATLDEMLDFAKGRIGLYLELKGSTADERMVDDVVRMVQDRGMEREVVLLSLDYGLIKYIEEKYPDMASGYLYFFAIGSPADMVSDYLIMEEREATAGNVEAILEKGKGVVVWTVNTEESMKRFLNSQVGGIITDRVPLLKKEIEAQRNMTDIEIILNRFLGLTGE